MTRAATRKRRIEAAAVLTRAGYADVAAWLLSVDKHEQDARRQAKSRTRKAPPSVTVTAWNGKQFKIAKHLLPDKE